LDDILNDGRFKAQFETGSSSGYFDYDARGEIETDIMNNKGFSLSKAKSATIYGYLAKKENVYDNNNLDHYGDVVVVLKKEARKRTTFVEGDSLDENHNGKYRTSPSPIDIPSIYSLKPSRHETKLNKIENPDFQVGGREVSPYWEAQIHGGVKVSDIEKVVFTSDSPSDTLKNALKSKKIKWEDMNF
jgi:hypothetical protein